MYSNRPYQSIKKQVGVVILLLAFFISAYSQYAYDSCWIIGDNQTLLFDNNGTVRSDTPNLKNKYAISSIKTNNGNFLFTDNVYIYNKFEDTLNYGTQLLLDSSIFGQDYNQANLYGSIFLNTSDTNIYYLVTKRATKTVSMCPELGSNNCPRYIYIYI